MMMTDFKHQLPEHFRNIFLTVHLGHKKQAHLRTAYTLEGVTTDRPMWSP